MKCEMRFSGTKDLTIIVTAIVIIVVKKEAAVIMITLIHMIQTI